jgi:hypothetical protein
MKCFLNSKNEKKYLINTSAFTDEDYECFYNEYLVNEPIVHSLKCEKVDHKIFVDEYVEYVNMDNLNG